MDIDGYSATERKRAQNWFQRQLSRKMSQEDYDSSGGIEHVTAIAAAAFAVNSFEGSGTTVQNKIKGTPQTTLGKTKSKTEYTKSLIPIKSMSRTKSKMDEPLTSVPIHPMNKRDSEMDDAKASSTIQPVGVSRRFPGEGSIEVLDEQKNKTPVRSGTDEITRESATAPAPSIKKAPTSMDEQQNISGNMKPESSSPIPNFPGSATSPPPPPEPKRNSSASPRVAKAPADAWEESELAKIKERYEKLYATIDEWESKKKLKARRELDKRESELERRRIKSLDKFKNDMEYINQIADGARAQAYERKRKEELKAKEKATIVRKTGELPVTCFCF